MLGILVLCKASLSVCMQGGRLYDLKNSKFSRLIKLIFYCIIIGPPSPPTITFDPNNRTLCFSAYSHPEFPLQSYDVQVTDNTSVTSSLSATYSTNSTLCLMVTFDPSPSICFPFRVSVTASSDTGTSPLSEMTFESNSEGNYYSYATLGSD